MMKGLEKYIRMYTNLQCSLAMVFLAALMTIGAADVIGRYFFSFPIKGAYEISEVILAGLVFFGLAFTLSERGHVSVDSFVTRFNPLIQAVIGAFVSLVSFGVFVLLGWQGAVMAYKSWVSNRLIDVILVPIAPFQLFVTIGASAVCLELILLFFQYLRCVKEEG